MTNLLVLPCLFLCCTHASVIRLDENSNIAIKSSAGKNVTINGVDVVGKISVVEETLSGLQSLSSQQNQIVSQLSGAVSEQNQIISDQNKTISEQSRTISLLQRAIEVQNASLSQQDNDISNQGIVITMLQETLALQNKSLAFLQAQIHFLSTDMSTSTTSTTPTPTPTPTTTLTNSPLELAQIGAEANFMCALMRGAGGVRCWGSNEFGQLGDSTTSNLRSPPSSDVLTGVAQIVTGYEHTCALMNATGGVRCWGWNNHGQLGDGNIIDVHSPPSSDLLTGVVQIAAGWAHTCVLMNGTGGVRCWGYNHYGQLGDGSTADLYSPPNSDVLMGVEQIVAGDYHTCALMEGIGSVYCWGWNNHGQLGDGTTTDILSPSNAQVSSGVAQIAAGEFHTCVLMRGNGGVRCWGYNFYGQLGDGSITELHSLPSGDVLTKVARISAGGFFSCALMSQTGGV